MVVFSYFRQESIKIRLQCFLASPYLEILFGGLTYYHNLSFIYHSYYFHEYLDTSQYNAYAV